MLQSWDHFMTANGAVRAGEDSLILQSELGDLARVPPWIERMACAHAIPAPTEFAMNLCLEEILSNIIRHGYANESGHEISVQYSTIAKNVFQLVIEDQAMPFDPVAAAIPPIEETLSGERDGGLGIRLVKNFADSMKYESLAGGNRLSIRFLAPTEGPGDLSE
jgi:anti-sigma regulatory factor (Ser/Thr protein kinase)